jgi:hypothetical protein
VVVVKAVSVIVDSNVLVDEGVAESDGEEVGASGVAGDGVTTITVDSDAVLLYSEASGDTPSIQEVVL